MTTFKTLCIAGITALILPLGAATPASAQEALVNFSAGKKDPFEVSTQICIDTGRMDDTCITNEGQVGKVTVGDIIIMMESTIYEFREMNGWGDEVTPDTEIPLGASMRFG